MRIECTGRLSERAGFNYLITNELRFVRYADDCRIYLPSKVGAKRVLGSIPRFLKEKLLLEVKREKTKICRPVKLTLLGYGFVSVYQKEVNGKYRLRVAPTSMKRLKLKLKGLTCKTA